MLSLPQSSKTTSSYLKQPADQVRPLAHQEMTAKSADQEEEVDDMNPLVKRARLMMDKGYTSDVVREQTRDNDLADVMEELEEKEVQAMEEEMAARKLNQSKTNGQTENATEMDTSEESPEQDVDSAGQPQKSPSSNPKQSTDKDGQPADMDLEDENAKKEKTAKQQQKRPMKAWSPADSQAFQTSTLRAKELHRQGLSADQAAKKGESTQAVKVMRQMESAGQQPRKPVKAKSKTKGKATAKSSSNTSERRLRNTPARRSKQAEEAQSADSSLVFDLNEMTRQDLMMGQQKRQAEQALKEQQLKKRKDNESTAISASPASSALPSTAATTAKMPAALEKLHTNNKFSLLASVDEREPKQQPMQKAKTELELTMDVCDDAESATSERPMSLLQSWKHSLSKGHKQMQKEANSGKLAKYEAKNLRIMLLKVEEAQGKVEAALMEKEQKAKMKPFDFAPLGAEAESACRRLSQLQEEVKRSNVKEKEKKSWLEWLSNEKYGLIERTKSVRDKIMSEVNPPEQLLQLLDQCEAATRAMEVPLQAKSAAPVESTPSPSSSSSSSPANLLSPAIAAQAEKSSVFGDALDPQQKAKREAESAAQSSQTTNSPKQPVDSASTSGRVKSDVSQLKQALTAAESEADADKEQWQRKHYRPAM